MIKKSLIALAVIAMAMPAFAGKLKIHDPWPTQLVPQEVCKIDVVLDVGFYIEIVDEKPIKVTQDTGSSDPAKTYTGCKKTDVKSNFAAQLIASIAGRSAAGGNWSVTVDPSTVPAGTTNVEICVKGTGVDISKLTGGSKNVKVAEVTIKVLPAA
ncbi:MAG: hypothetical protein QHH07_06855 [Sedimentisphaerales bacterium]|nr:hypothetical protein [Sedimentisphaerales bacterium]